MLFGKKTDRAMKWLRDKNIKSRQSPENKNDMDNENYDPKAEYDAENSTKLEKGDIPALIIAALLVFGPLILILILILKWLV